MAWAAVASAIISAYAAYQSGKAQKEAADFNASVAEQEARAKEKQATYEEEASRDRLKRLMGTQRALYAKAGVDLSSGSPLLVLSETERQGEEEALMIRYRGSVSAAQARNQASVQRMYGEQAYTAGTLRAASTFLSGLGAAYGTTAEKGYSYRSPYSGRRY